MCVWGVSGIASINIDDNIEIRPRWTLDIVYRISAADRVLIRCYKFAIQGAPSGSYKMCFSTINSSLEFCIAQINLIPIPVSDVIEVIQLFLTQIYYNKC